MTSGTTRGTSFVMRKALEFEMTRAAGGSELWLKLVGNSGVERSEDDSGQLGRWAALGRVGTEHHGGDARGAAGVSSFTAAGLVVAFAGAAVAGGNPGDFKPGMLAQQLDEALTDHAGRAQDGLLFVVPSNFGAPWLKHSACIR